MIKLYSVVDVASLVGLSPKRINQLGQELINAGHGQKVGKVLVFQISAVDYIKNRPDRRKKA